MMKRDYLTRLLPLTLVAVGLSLPATMGLAQGAKEQLALQLGVNADDYTTSELTQMKCIMDGDYSEAEKNRLLGGIKGYGAISEAASDLGKEQLAMSIGVNPDDYTSEQLTLLKSMIEDDTCTLEEAKAYVAQGETLTPEAASAKQQLAAALGVDPTAYTLVELTKMYFEEFSG